MRRTSPECGTTPPSCILQALLLLLFMAIALPDCNAAAISDNNTSSILTRMVRTTEALGNRNYPSVGVYPPVILFNILGEYHIRVEKWYDNNDRNHRIVLSDDRRIVSERSANRYKSTFVLGFNAFSIIYSGSLRVKAEYNPNSNNYVSIGTFDRIHSMPFEHTKATMTADFRYYGFPIQVSATLPSGFTPSGYLLVPPATNCLDVSTCKVQDGCNVLANRHVLPPPGTYNLCVTANRWESRYLPWGQSSIDVTALVSTPLTLFLGIVPSITLSVAHTGRRADGAEEWRGVLVRCSGDNCPTVRDQRGVEIIDVSVCNANAIKDGVKISSLKLTASLGVYALCVVDGESYASPAAFPVRVEDAPFSMKVIESSDDFVELEVSNGNIGGRTEKYAICIAEYLSPCSTVTFNDNKCTSSADPNSKTVRVDVSRVSHKDQINFCLVSGDVLYNNVRFLDVVGELKYESPLPPTTLGIWALIGIVFASIVFVLVIVIIIVCCVKRRKNNDETSFVGENWIAENIRAPSAQSFHESMVSGGLGSTYAEEFHSGLIPPVYASNNSLFGGPQEQIELMGDNYNGVQY